MLPLGPPSWQHRDRDIFVDQFTALRLGQPSPWHRSFDTPRFNSIDFSP